MGPRCGRHEGGVKTFLIAELLKPVVDRLPKKKKKKKDLRDPSVGVGRERCFIIFYIDNAANVVVVNGVAKGLIKNNKQ